MSKSPNIDLVREKEPIDCWECDKEVTRSGRGCGQAGRQLRRARGKRRFQRELLRGNHE